MSSLRLVRRKCVSPSFPLMVCRKRALPSSCRRASSTASSSSSNNNNNSNMDPLANFRLLNRSSWILHSDLEPYILSPTDETPQVAGLPFGLHFLGTGAGSPSLQRGCSATALSLGGKTYLFDAGESVQRQFMASRRLRLGDVTKIFITHLHGDHIFGLPGFLLCLQSISKLRERQKKEHRNVVTHRNQFVSSSSPPTPRVIEIYGPVGLFNYIAASVSLSCTELKHVHVDVYELTGGSRRWVHPGSLVDYSEFRHRGLRRHTIPQNKDGTWTLEVPKEMTTPEQALRYSSSPSGVYVKAAQVMHITKLQCFGYVVQEPMTQPRNIDESKARAAGVAPSESYKLLKSGFPVLADDGSRHVQPEEVWKMDEVPNKSRKLALLGDCCAVPRPMMELCHDADLLIHEATFLESQQGGKVDFGGHSTAAMAASVAKQTQAKVLLLNHISAAHQNNPKEEEIVAEAESVLKDTPTKVQLSYDLLDLYVPRKGFPPEWQKLPVPPPAEQVTTSQSSTTTTVDGEEKAAALQPEKDVKSPTATGKKSDIGALLDIIDSKTRPSAKEESGKD